MHENRYKKVGEQTAGTHNASFLLNLRAENFFVRGKIQKCKINIKTLLCSAIMQGEQLDTNIPCMAFFMQNPEKPLVSLYQEEKKI